MFFYLKVVFILFITSTVSFSQKFEWARSVYSINNVYGGNVSYPSIKDLAIDSVGNVYYVGFLDGIDDIDPTSNTTFINFIRGTFIQKIDSSGNLLWTKTFDISNGNISSFNRVNFQSIEIGEDGNLVVFGDVKQGTIDVDFGQNVFEVTSNNLFSNYFLLKVNADGDFIWCEEIFSGVKEYMNSNYISQFSSTRNMIEIDYLNNIYLSFSTYDTIMDTSLIYHKFNSNGVKQWSLYGNPSGFISSIDSIGNSYLTYKTGGAEYIDCDLSLDTFLLHFPPNILGDHLGRAIVKVNSDGVLQWGKSMYTSLYNEINMKNFLSNENGNICFDAGLYDTLILESNTGVIDSLFPVTPTNTSKNFFIASLDNDGILKFYRSFYADVAAPNSLELTLDGFDKFGNIFYGVKSGHLNPLNFDIDPGIGVHIANSSTNSVLAKMDESGNFLWVYDGGYSISTRVSGNGVNNPQPNVDLKFFKSNFYVTGFFGSNVDFDPTNNVYKIGDLNPTPTGTSITKFSQNVCDQFAIEVDTISDISCGIDTIAYISVDHERGTAPISYSWNNSSVDTLNYITTNTPGIFKVSIADSNECRDSVTVLIEEPKEEFDLSVNVIELSNNSLSFFVKNNGCVPTDVQLKTYCDQTSSISSISSNGTIVGDTVIWTFLQLDYTQPAESVYLSFNTTPVLPFIEVKAVVFPIIGDSDTTNNKKSYSFDMNNQSNLLVYPEGECEYDYIDSSSVLTYYSKALQSPIYRIENRLSSNLDLNTLSSIGSDYSHYEIENDTILVTVFHTDSIPQGFFKYNLFEIDHYDNLPNFTVIPSKLSSSTLYPNFADFTNFESEVSSIIVNDVSSLLSDTVSITETECENYAWMGNIYNQSGQYSTVVSNQYGCDSLLVLDLTIHYNDNSVLYVTECDSATINGYNYYSPGIYSQILPTNQGCDSSISVHFMNYPSYSLVYEDICDSIVINGIVYNETGVYYQSLVSIHGCDSTVECTINLQRDTTILNQVSLEGYVLNNVLYTEPGQYEQVLTNSYGCDSILILNLELEYLGLLEDKIKVSVVPNPFTDKISVYYDKPITSFFLHDLKGSNVEIKAEKLENRIEIDTIDLKTGVYFLIIRSEEKTRTIKLIKI